MPSGELFGPRLGERRRPRHDSLLVVTEVPTHDPRADLQTALNAALIHGQMVSTSTHLGPHTSTAIDAVARAHPDATAEEIALAYDAFAREHGLRSTSE
jgi:hypothetical protein